MLQRVKLPLQWINSLTVPYTENPSWYQQFDLRQIRKLREGASYHLFKFCSRKKLLEFKIFMYSIL